MFRIAICEDSHQHMEAVLTLINKYKEIRSGLEIQIHSFGSGKDMLIDWNNGKEYDLFLFEILMPDMSGIELAKELRSRGEDAPLVFLTSSAEHALDAFRVHATQYILKPIYENELFPVLDKIVAMQDQKESKHLLLSTPERTVKIPFSSIVCVESINRTMRVFLTDGTRLDSKTLRIPFATAVASLLWDSRFLRTHNSFVLNMDRVREISGNWFVMENGTEVPVPRYKQARAKAAYFNYLSDKDVGLADRQRCRTYSSVTT